MTTDIMSLPVEVSTQLSEEAIGDCTMDMLAEWARVGYSWGTWEQGSHKILGINEAFARNHTIPEQIIDSLCKEIMSHEMK